MSTISTVRIRDGLAVMILVVGLTAVGLGDAADAVVDDELGSAVCGVAPTLSGPVDTERPRARWLDLPQ